MKFVALALALLLAVGSQAASLPADAPSQLAHVRAAVDVYLTQVKESANKVLEHLDDTEYRDLKTTLSQRLEDLHNQIKSWQASVSPLTDSVVSTIADSTADLRTSIINDIENLRTELLPKRAHLRDVIKAHLGDYYAQLQPLLNEYHQKHQAEMADLKTKLEPIIEALTAKLVTNVEETKAALVPIVEAVRLKVNARLESLKSSIKPYVDEYKDQLEQAYHHAQSMNADEITALKTKIEPLAEDVVAKVQAIFQNIVATFIKN